MAPGMAQPRSCPRPVFERVPPKKNRNVALKPYRTLIEKFYIDEGRELKWIMQYMKDQCEQDFSVKQYKSQFKTWGLRHNLTQRDAAFILRLLNQARKEGRDEVVLFSGQPRRRDYIQKYIKRKEDIVDEDDLLSCISDTDETPSHIELQTLHVEPRRPSICQLPPTPPSSSPAGPLQSQFGSRDISPMRVQIPSPLYTPRSSCELVVLEDAAQPATVEEWQAYPANIGPVDARPKVHSAESQAQSLVPHSTTGWQGNAPVFEESDGLDTAWQAELTHAVLSSTPAVVYQSNFDLDIRRVVGEQIHSAQLRDGSYAADFVMRSLCWLACSGQDNVNLQSDGDEHLERVSYAFMCMLTTGWPPAEEVLGCLSVVATLFGCYAQEEKLVVLLKKCDALTQEYYGPENPLTITVAFMHRMLKGPSCPPHDLQRLTQVVSDMHVIFPQSRRPMLTARYHLAWANLENELKKEVRIPADFEPIRWELQELTEQCDFHFGRGRIETIMAAATLSRATYWCGHGITAEYILSQSVMPRVRENFVDSHPYVWEAKHRHAFFLFQLAKDERDGSRLAHLQLAEQLLREIVPARCRILGESNPKSINSMGLLRDVLFQQGRWQEAQTLSEWCKRETG